MEEQMIGQKCIVLGATGAVGSSITTELLGSNFCSQITAVVRRQTDMFAAVVGHEKLRLHVAKLDEIDTDAQLAEAIKDHKYAFCAIGVGNIAAASREEIRMVEHDYVIKFAKLCKKVGVRHFSWLGSVGVDKKSSIYASKIKAEVEEELEGFQFDRTSFFRPAVIQTPSYRYGARDVIYQGLVPKISWMFPEKWRHVKVEDLGRCFRINAEKTNKPGLERLEWPEFQQLMALDPRDTLKKH